MSKLETVDRALDKYKDHKDEQVRLTLAVLGGALREAARRTDERLASDHVAPAWSSEEVEAALKGKAPLIGSTTTDIDREGLLDAVTGVAAALMDAYKDDEDMKAAFVALDWDRYVDDEAVELMRRDPDAWIGRLEETLESPVETSIVLPACLLGAKVMLSPYARDAGEAFRRFYEKDDTLHFDRALKCPFCGGDPLIAHVAQTPSHGKEKTLVCATCSTRWPFERIRCAVCGEMATSELSYVHDEGDPAHRLHVCNTCETAFPTVFSNDTAAFSPVVESIVMMGLEESYFAEAPNPAQ